MQNVLRWVKRPMEERELRNRVKNKMIRPTTIPQTEEALEFEQAVAREALRLAYRQHKEFATTLKGVQQQRTVGDTFKQQNSGQSIVDDMKLNLLVASGGVLSHAPQMEQTAMMLLDSFEPQGVTELAKDSIFMMPHLGVLASIHPRAAMEVFERDCLILLGTSIAAKGTARSGTACFHYRFRHRVSHREEQGEEHWEEQGELAFGDLKILPLEVGETAEIEVTPARRVDVGAGPGRPLSCTVRGGTVGVIFDARGRPLWPEN